MKFDQLHGMIPYAKGGKRHVLTMSPYNGITLALPGRHAEDTAPVGGDFVVMVDDENMDWVKHQFTHNDLFKDLENKTGVGAASLAEDYRKVIQNGIDPEKVDVSEYEDLPGIHPQTFLYAVQCLAVAEHRRYSQHEAKFGGRFLPFRFAAGIVESLWTADECARNERRGRPGVEYLEKIKGTPILTKELMK